MTAYPAVDCCPPPTHLPSAETILAFALASAPHRQPGCMLRPLHADAPRTVWRTRRACHSGPQRSGTDLGAAPQLPNPYALPDLQDLSSEQIWPLESPRWSTTRPEG